VTHLNVELEAYFDYWTSTKTKNRYFGIKTWPEEEAGKMKVTGFELKAANAAPISKTVQEIAFNLIGTGATEEQVNAAIYPIIKAVKKGEISVVDLAPYGRVKKPFSDYQTVVPMAARAAKYYNDNMTPVNPFKQGDGAQWVYISSTPEDMPNEVVFPKRDKNLTASVVAFREPSEIQEFPLDYDVIIVKMIHRKLESVYNAMGWELKNALAASKPTEW